MITFGAAGAVAYSASGGSTIAVPYPAGVTAGQGIIMVIGQKPAAAGGGGITTPSGWGLSGGDLGKGGYGSTLGAGTGNTNIYMLTKIAVGNETGSLTVTLSGNGIAWGQMLRFTSTAAGWAGAFYLGAEQASAPGTAISQTTGGTLAMQGQDMIIAAMATAYGSSGTVFSSTALAASGLYIPTTTEVSEPNTTLGNDVGGTVVYARVGNGSATSALTWQSALSGTTTDVRGPIGFLVLRESLVVSPASVDKVSAAELLEAEAAYPAPVQKMSAVQVLEAEAPYPPPLQKLAALELLVAMVGELAPPSTNDLWVWNGTAEIPASTFVWDGAAEIPTTVEVLT